MDKHAYQDLLNKIRDAAATAFNSATSEEEVCEIEEVFHDEITYQATLAQSAHVTPPQGWDPLGR